MTTEPSSPEAAETPDNGWLYRRLVGLSRSEKRLILCVSDAIIFSASLWLALAVRYGALSFPRDERFDGLYFALPAIGVAIYWFLGLYRSMLRSMESRTILVIGFGAFMAALIIPAWSFFDPEMIVPRTAPFTYGLFVIFGVGAMRLILREIYRAVATGHIKTKRVVIYGAGVVGTQLAAFLDNAPDYRVVAFVDDNPKLERAKVRGHQIFHPRSIETLKSKYDFEQVILAMNNISPARQRQIIQQMGNIGAPISMVPRVEDMLMVDSHVRQVKPIHIEDLLGRQTVDPIEGLLESNLKGKTIMVTGAAGSIGSEICRQALKTKPKKIIVFDVSEFGLYSIEQEFSKRENRDTEIVIALGSVLDRPLVRRLLTKHKVELVYHAAAYKHVPIVEDNILVAIRNNAFGTRVVAEEAIAAKVDRFTLISTDKAVRPTSVMGASKRVAELVVQDLDRRSGDTVMSMVRFGNVLGSSGSVIPLFRKQIDQGGPVTLTHKEVTRYFMTISEASQLVLQASLLSSGGEVFVLDMGEPVKLVDLAKLMIQLSGNHERIEGGADGGIEIQEIGLRPGEKLYEELLIGANVSGTKHPKIMKSMEICLSPAETKALMNFFDKCLESGDSDKAVAKLRSTVSLKPLEA